VYMVLGLFSSPLSANVAVSNLMEADFDPASLSIIMQDQNQATALAQTSGPWQAKSMDKFLNFLATTKAAANSKLISQTLETGGVVIGIEATGDVAKTALEMLNDHTPLSAQDIG
jgi:hypothetical protein